MSSRWPAAAGPPVASGRLRTSPEDFRVCEVLGFEPEGDGEHVFLHLEKRELNTQELAQRISGLSGIHPRDISFSGMKDRNAVTRQWFSVRMAGKAEPDWHQLEGPEVTLLSAARHRRKLKRGVHRANAFRLVLREVVGDREQLEERLQRLRVAGAPNYFGEQRFGREGSTLDQARHWMASGGRRISRNKRSLYLSALRAYLFNHLLAERVEQGDWDRVQPGDTCILHGTRSQFRCETVDGDIERRALEGDLHPGLPLWGRGGEVSPRCLDILAAERETCEFLEQAGLELGWRPARLIPDDFCWQFCDDGSLQLEFSLGAGSYATALLAEFARY